MSNPISLSDAEFEAIERYAQPLSPADRSHFLATVAMRLRAETTLGPGLITRICAEAQRAYLDRAVGGRKVQPAPKHSYEFTKRKRR